MEEQKVTSALYFRSLTVTYAAMFLAPVITAVVMISLRSNVERVATGAMSTTPLLYAVMAVGLSSIAMSFVLFNTLVAKAAEKPTLSEKLRGYQSASIVRFGLLEAPAIFATVAFYLTGAYWFLAASAIVLALLVTIAPSRQRVGESLRLSHEETQLLDDPTAIVAEWAVNDNTTSSL